MPHLNYYVDLCANVYIVFQNKVLLRYHDKYNEWLPVGGHVDPNEDLIMAAKREALEEAGLEVELFNPYSPAVPEVESYINQIPPCFLTRNHINTPISKPPNLINSVIK